MREAPIDFADAIGSWQLPRCAGWVDGALRGAGGWTLSGWAVLPGSGPFDVLRAHWNGNAIHEAMLTERPDVATALYWMAKSDRAGFVVALPPGEDAGRLDLVGEQQGRAVAAMATTFLAPEHETAPLPPAAMSERVSGMSGDAFRLSGLKGFTDLWDQVRRHADGASSPRVLDWGCGCGRVARYLARAPGAEVFGCDIDGEAVAWCEENLEGRFSRTGPDPPLPYADGELDVVLGFSVFTHLSRAEQARWLSRDPTRALARRAAVGIRGRALRVPEQRQAPLASSGATVPLWTASTPA